MSEKYKKRKKKKQFDVSEEDESRCSLFWLQARTTGDVITYDI